ncbi:MAG: UDP-N-acetylmuramoyl-L-alanine--D-glutamate ligase [Burkholderiales bacterium]|nr:MAG: UDP-N-acetylmuramoyl-L-alanine--D-glutamate ligase [Burkholderiales bacterium]
MSHLKDQNVLILGLGISGLSMARWCARQGARVTVADTRAAPPQRAALDTECPQARFVCSLFDASLMTSGSWDLVARSPGLAPDQLEAVRQWTVQHGVSLVGELDLFARALSELAVRNVWPYRPNVLAITGTNGKTTVTSLTGLLLERAGRRVAVAGNIGPALLDVLSAALDHEARELARETEEALQAQAQEPQVPPAVDVALPSDVAPGIDADSEQGADTDRELPDDDAGRPAEGPDDTPADGPLLLQPPEPQAPPPPYLPQDWVLELSSFQLDGVAGGPWDVLPTAATLLNISEDHLDWHGTLDAYVQAKRAVFGAEALMVLNRDDPLVMAMRPALVTVKVGGRNRQQPARPHASFGLDAPQHPGDWGIESVNGMDWLVRAQALDETRRRGRAEVEIELYMQRLMPVDALRIRGRHNAANALAALALATSTGAALGPMLHGLREYRGEPHRVEPVAVIDGVEYFDDSKGTNVGATLAAVRGLGAERRLVMIMGGDGKGQDFRPLAEPLARHARAVLLIGRDAPVLREQVGPALSEAGVALEDAPDLSAAVASAARMAQAGDAVLMSPACASLDMFDNYVHRARVFVEAVQELALARGVSLEVGS